MSEEKPSATLLFTLGEFSKALAKSKRGGLRGSQPFLSSLAPEPPRPEGSYRLPCFVKRRFGFESLTGSAKSSDGVLLVMFSNFLGSSDASRKKKKDNE